MFQKNIGKLATITGKGASIDKSYKKAGDGALKLDNPLLEADKNGRAGDSAYLTIEGEDGDNLLSGRTQLTFSFWYKTMDNKAAWAFSASKNNEKNEYPKEHYIGFILENNAADFQRWNNSDGRQPTIKVSNITNNSWNYITIVMDETSSQVYLNGEKKGFLDNQPKLTDILTATSKLYFGAANWGNVPGEFYGGWIDEFDIYEGVLTEAQAKAQYDAFFESVTVNFKCGDTVLETRTEKWYNEEDTYTYVLQDADKELFIGNDVYLRTSEQTLTTDKNTKEINVLYEKATVNAVTGTYTADTRVGIAPKNLPTEVSLSLNGTDAIIKAPVTWNVPEAAYASVGTYKIKGQVLGIEATLTLTVKVRDDYLLADYSFDDDDMADAVNSGHHGVKKGTDADSITIEEGLKGNALKLPGGAKGTAYVELSDDLLKIDGGTAKDITISLFTKRETSDWSWPMALLSSSTSNYLAFINRGDGAADFRAESNCDGGSVQAQYNGDSNDYEWNHFAIVADSTNHKLTLYKNGKKMAEGVDEKGKFDVSKLATAAAKNELGHSPYNDGDYAGYIDEFKVYNVLLEAEEIQSICDETLYEEQIAKTKEALEITYADGEDKDNVLTNLTLPTTGAGIGTTVEWTTDTETVVRADGTVMRPSKLVGDKTVNLTATIRAKGYNKTGTKVFTIKVKCLEGISFEALKQGIKDAETLYARVESENIYKESCLKELQDAITAAKLVAAKEEEADSDVTEAEVDAAAAAIREAVKKEIELKSLEELDQTTLLARYPLTNDAKNVVRDTRHGTAGEKISFSREMGATFSGGSPFSSAIKLPADEFTIARRMTFSFWAYDQGNHKSNAFGLGSGDVFSENVPEGKAQAHLFYVNTNDNGNLLVGMRTKYWNSGINVTTPKAPDNTWQHIVCVLDGQMLTLYINGEEKLTQDMGAQLTDMWNADPNTRHIYIGNCAYAANNDNDYLGSIKDFRIYNTALAPEQVAEIKGYMDGLSMEYAKSDLLAAMGSHLVNGKNHVNITTNQITLVSTGVQGETITWKSSDNATINEETGAVTFGDDTKAVILTATIKLADETVGTVEFECLVGRPSENVNARALRALLEEADKLKETDYIPAAWAEYIVVHERALSVVDFAQNQAEVDKMVEELKSAMATLEEARRGDKTELLSVIQQANLLKDSTALPYPQAARDALQMAINRARAVNTNTSATQAMVDDAVAALNQAIKDFEATVPEEERPAGTEEKTGLASKIAEAEALMDETKYTEVAIAEFNNVLEAVKAVAAKDDLTKGEVAKALQDLETASNTLKDTASPASSADKTKLTDKIDEAAAADTSQYSQVSVAAYREALDALRAVVAQENVTKGEINQALADLEDVIAALEATADPAGTEEKNELNAKIVEAAKKDLTNYPKSAVDKYNATLASLREVAMKVGVTKGEIAQALADLDAAVAELEKSSGTPDTEAKEQAKTELTNFINANKPDGTQADYTEESWNVYQKALSDANAILENNDATAEQIKAVKDALERAFIALKKVPGTQDTEAKEQAKKELANFINTKKPDGAQADYTEESWSAYQKALDDANAILKNDNATAAQMKAAKDALERAFGALAKKTVTPPDNTQSVKVSSIKFASKSYQIAAGKKLDLSKEVTIAPKDAANKKLTYSINKKYKKYASVNSKGIVTTKKAGAGKTITVTATAADGSKVSGTVKVKIMKHAVTKITVKKKTLSVKPGKKVTIKASVRTNGKKANKKLTYTSSQTKWATVNSKGVVSAKKAGKGKTVTITVKSTDGTNKSVKVKVKISKK